VIVSAAGSLSRRIVRNRVIWASFVNLQFKEDIGIRAEARGQRHRSRQIVEPVATGLFGRASFTTVERVA
jgi:hypothetical protein